MVKPTSSAAHRWQTWFFDRVANLQQALALFDYLPDVFFFIKDAEGRFMRMTARLTMRDSFHTKMLRPGAGPRSRAAGPANATKQRRAN